MELRPLFCPTSVAVVGASPTAGGSRNLIHNLRLHGFQGQIYPVNPKYREIEGLPCYPSLAELPESPDAVALNISAERSVEALAQAARLGARSAVIFGVGFGESGAAGIGRQAELVRIAREFNLPVVGPNCMGVVAPAYRCSLWTGALHSLEHLAGNVGLISHSGSVAIALLSNGRFGFSLVTSSGNEAVVETPDLLDWYAEDPQTLLIAMFLETVRSPERFRAAALKAHRAGKPIVVLKVGKSEHAARNVASHSGALAGSHRITSALFRSLGICEVESLEEMVETIVALRSPHRPAGERIGVTHCSGGEASLLLDLAAPLGLEFPPLAPETRERLLPVWDASTEVGNPLDTWGAMPYTESYPICLGALADQPDVDLVILDQDAPEQPPAGMPDLPYRTPMNVARFAAQSAERTGKPHFYISNLAGAPHLETQSILESAGVPLLLGLANGMRAIRHWLQFHRWQRDGVPALAAAAAPLPMYGGSSISLAQPGPLTEVESKQHLSMVGLRSPRETLCRDTESAVNAARALGFPVAVKVVGRALPHKTEVSGVHLGLQSPESVLSCCRELEARLGDQGLEGFLVAEMVPKGREFILGIARDPLHGLAILCGAGGTMAEVFEDVVFRVPPISDLEAEAMISELKVARTLGAWRGLPPADRAGLRSAIVALSRFAEQYGERIAEVDINPLVVHPAGEGVTMVDALVVLRR